MVGILKPADADRAKFAETRAHRYHWPAGRQIADAAIAEPSAVGSNVNILRHREFAARTGDKIAVGPHVGRNWTRIDEAPAASSDNRAYSIVRRQHGYAKTAVRPVPRQIEKSKKIHVLRPNIAQAAILDILALVLPGGDGREAARRVARLGPQVDVDGRAGRAPRDTAQRHRAVLRPEIFAVGEEMSMRIQIGARFSIGARVLQLLVHRIRVDHDPDRAGEVLVPQPRRAAEIDDSIRLPIEGAHFVPRQAVMHIVNCVPIGPALTESVFLHRLLQTQNIIVARHNDAVCTRVERIGAAIFDVPASVS